MVSVLLSLVGFAAVLICIAAGQPSQALYWLFGTMTVDLIVWAFHCAAERRAKRDLADRMAVQSENAGAKRP